MRIGWLALVPALLALLYAGWCGNLLGGVTAAGSTTALVLLLATTLFLADSPAGDPLRLGAWGRWTPAALWGAIAASAWASPVGRAALEPVVLLPAFLLLPAAFAHCWSTDAARRIGLRAVSAALATVAAWSLLARGEGGGYAAASGAGPGPASGAEPFLVTLAPLGHHTLFAVWATILLPLAVLPLREKTPWRWLGAVAACLGIAAVVAGGSLAGGAGLACEALLAASGFGLLRLRRHRQEKFAGRAARVGALALLALLPAATQLPRLQRILTHHDPSASARLVYLRAGWDGWRERPWLGWGPGSVGWTASWFLRPRPGLNPWGEAVGELHCLPVHLAYEVGALGLAGALATGGLFARRRWAERRAAADRGMLAAACLGLAGALIACLGTASLAVVALPLAAALAAGAALAGGQRRVPISPPAAAAPGVAPLPASAPSEFASSAFPAAESAFLATVPSNVAASPAPAPLPAGAPRGGEGSGSRGAAGRRPLLWLYGAAAAAALLSPEAARWHYDRAVGDGEMGRPRAAAAELAAAVRLDPAFPLYRMRLALLADGEEGRRGVAAALGWRAARDARGIGLLWLVAGVLGRAHGEVWAPAALEQSCDLDPLAPFAPFYLAAAQPSAPAAPRVAARALLAEPRLLAASFWEDHPLLFRHTLDEVRAWPGIDNGWRLALLDAAPAPAARRGPTVRLGLAIDMAGFTQSTSLHLFRRLPWPSQWPLLSLRRDLVPGSDLPPATALASTLGATFETLGCGSRAEPRPVGGQPMVNP